MIHRASALLVASVLRYASQLAILLVIVRFAGSSAAGEYALALAITAPVFIVLSFGMRTVLLTLQSETRLAIFVKLRVVTAAGSIAVSVLISAVFAPAILPLLLLVAVSKAVDSYVDVLSAYLQRLLRVLALVAFAAANSVAVVGAAVVVAVAGGDSFQILAGATISGAVVGCVLMSIYVARGRVRVLEPASQRNGGSWEVIRAGFPVGLSNGIVVLLTAVPQYVLAAVVSSASVARFAVLTYVLVAGEMILNALAQAWIADARVLEQQGRLGSLDVFLGSLRWTGFMVVVGAGGVLAAWWIVPRVFGASYALNWVEAIVLTACFLFSPSVFITATALAVRNRYRSSLLSSIVSLVVGLALSFVLVPKFEVAGALVVGLVALVLRALVNYISLSRKDFPRERPRQDSELID